jgi:hypothetical protein
MSIDSPADDFYCEVTEEEYPYTVIEVERMLARQTTEKLLQTPELPSLAETTTSINCAVAKSVSKAFYPADSIYISSYYDKVTDIQANTETILGFGQIGVYENKFNAEKINLSDYTREKGYVITKVGNAPTQMGFKYKGIYVLQIINKHYIEAFAVYEITQDDSQADGYNDKS